VTAIAIKQHRVLPVEWDVGAVDQANRDLGAVRRSGPDAGGLVISRVEFLTVRPGKDLLFLAQDLLPSSQVELVDPGGRRKGGEDEAQDGRVPLAIPGGPDGRDLLAEVDWAELGPTVGDIHQVALRNGVLAGLEDKVVLEAVHTLDASVVAMRHEDGDVVQGGDLADRMVA